MHPARSMRSSEAVPSNDRETAVALQKWSKTKNKKSLKLNCSDSTGIIPERISSKETHFRNAPRSQCSQKMYFRIGKFGMYLKYFSKTYLSTKIVFKKYLAHNLNFV